MTSSKTIPEIRRWGKINTPDPERPICVRRHMNNHRGAKMLSAGLKHADLIISTVVNRLVQVRLIEK